MNFLPPRSPATTSARIRQRAVPDRAEHGRDKLLADIQPALRRRLGHRRGQGREESTFRATVEVTDGWATSPTPTSPSRPQQGQEPLSELEKDLDGEACAPSSSSRSRAPAPSRRRRGKIFVDTKKIHLFDPESGETSRAALTPPAHLTAPVHASPYDVRRDDVADLSCDQDTAKAIVALSRTGTNWNCEQRRRIEAREGLRRARRKGQEVTRTMTATTTSCRRASSGKARNRGEPSPTRRSPRRSARSRRGVPRGEPRGRAPQGAHTKPTTRSRPPKRERAEDDRPPSANALRKADAGRRRTAPRTSPTRLHGPKRSRPTPWSPRSAPTPSPPARGRGRRRRAPAAHSATKPPIRP